MIKASRLTQLSIIGGLFGFALDYIHVASGVLGYTKPDFIGSSIWVIPLFTAITAFGGVILANLARQMDFPPVSARRLMIDLVMLTVAHLVNALFVGQNMVCAGLMVPLVLLTAHTDRSKVVWCAMAIGAVLGPLGEAAISTAGFFTYAYPDFIVPLWLPLIWAIAARSFLNFSTIFLQLSGRTSYRSKVA